VVKSIWLVFDLLCIIYIYKIGDFYFYSEEKRNLFVNFYVLCPFIFLYTAYRGIHEIMTLFFVLASVYYFLKDKRILSYTIMGIGFMHSFFPIYLIIPYFLYSINQEKEFKKFLLVIPITISIVFLSYLPYLILIPEEISQDFINILTKSNYTINFASIFLPDIMNETLFTIDLHFLQMDISLYHIYVLIILLLLFFLFYFKYKVKTKKDLIRCITCFFLILPFLTRSFHFRIFIWVFPFFSLLLLDYEDRRKIQDIPLLKRNYIQITTFMIINIFIAIISAIFYLENPNELISMEIFLIIVLVYIVIWTIFILSYNLFYSLIFAMELIVFSIYYVLFYYTPFWEYRLEINLIFLIIYSISFLFFVYIIFLKWSTSLKENI